MTVQPLKCYCRCHRRTVPAYPSNHRSRIGSGAWRADGHLTLLDWDWQTSSMPLMHSKWLYAVVLASALRSERFMGY